SAGAGQLWGANFKSNPLFASSGPTKDDIFQGGVGDCYFMSALSAIAKAKPEYIKNMVVDLGDGTYAVRFYRNGQPNYVRVDADLWTVSPGGSPTYAKLGQENCLWVPVWRRPLPSSAAARAATRRSPAATAPPATFWVSRPAARASRMA